MHLLSGGPATGYAVSKGIGKAVANVYKALEGLAHKGAVEFSSSDSKLASAISWQRLLAREQKKFTANIEQLTTAFQKLPQSAPDEQVYQLKQAEQVIEQCLEFINSAEHVLLADLEPAIAERLKESLEAASARGVRVWVKLYEPLDIKGPDITLRQSGSEVYGKTTDVNLTLSVDGKKTVTALLSTDMKHVIQAFHSRSALIAFDYYFRLLYELSLSELKPMILDGDITAAQSHLEATKDLHPFSSENAVFQHFKSRYNT